MKKFLKTLAKKSMSLFLAIVMILSCWIFIAPEENQASAAYKELSAKLTAEQLADFFSFYGVTAGSQNINTITVSTSPFAGDSSINSSLYKNILYIGKVSGEDTAGSVSNIKNDLNGAIESFGIHYPVTVILEDGVNTPQFGVSIHKDGANDWDAHHWGTSVSGNFGLVNSSWYGYVQDRYDTQIFYDAYNGSNKSCGQTVTGSTNSNNTYNGTKGKWYWLANVMKYTGNLGEDYNSATYATNLKPTVETYLGHSGDGCDVGAANKKFTVTISRPIYVVNARPWKVAIEKAADMYLDIKSHPGKYTDASITALKAAVVNLFAVNPNTYFTGLSSDSAATTAVTTYASKAKEAIKAFYNASLVTKTYTVKFVKHDGTQIGTAQTITHGGNATAPTAPSRAADNDYHYTWKGWNQAYTNVTSDLTVVAEYNSIPHTFSGTIKYNDNGTHSWKCTVCDVYGRGDKGGQSTDCTFPDAWSGNATTHSKTCTVCGGVKSHTAAWENTTTFRKNAAACGVDAVYYKECSVCGVSSENFGGATWTATGSALKHIRALKESKEATCLEDGYEIYWCPVCKADSTLETITIKGGHTTDNETYVEVSDSQHALLCDTCGEVVKYFNHTYADGGLYEEPTCDTNGKHLYYCIVCNSQKLSEFAIDADGNFTTALVAPAPGHTGGTAYCDAKAICDSCGEAYGEFDPNNHRETTDHDGLAPTCSKEGYTAYKTCNACGTTIGKTTLDIDPDAHQYASATSNGDGKHSAVCQLNASHVLTDTCTDADKNCVCDKCGYNIPHVYNKTVATEDYLATAATCTDKATYYYSCQCGTSSEGTDAQATFEAGEALGHDYTEASDEVRSEATCTAAQTNWYGCSRCDVNAKDDAAAADKYYEVGTPLGHEASTAIVPTVDGKHGYKCVRYDACGAILNETDCTYANYVNNNDGTHTGTCICGDTYTEVHKLTTKWTHDTESGNATGTHTKYCTICDYKETKNCTYTSVTTDATCLAPTKTEYTCNDCGHAYTEFKDDQLDHSYTGDVVTDAENHKHGKLCVNGCNKPGAWVDCTLAYSKKDGDVHGVTCSVCNYVYDDEACSGGEATCIAYAVCSKCLDTYGSLKAHVFEGAAKNAAYGEHYYNCTTPGCTAYGVGSTVNATVPCNGGTAYCDAKAVCQECNTEYGEKDPDSHKNTTNHDGLAPTCMKEGYTAYKTCDACKKELGKEVIAIDPDAHKFSTTATSTNDGKHYYACEYNAEHKDVYDCFCPDPVIKAPTCLDGGYTINTCDDCKYVWHTEETSATGHSWGAWTPDGNGGHTRVCLNDENHVETGVCANDTSKVKTAPTCTEQGYTTYTCNLCAYFWNADYVDATGHTYTQKIVNTGSGHLFTDEDYAKIGLVDSECTNADYYWFDCKDCDKNGREETDYEKYPLNTLYYENGSASGHDFSGKSYKEAIKDKLILATPATCTDNETYYTYCVRCYLSSKGTYKEDTFTRWSSAIEHSYEDIVNENDLAENRKSEATCTAKAVYYKSCANCGDVSETTFTYGEILAHDYTEKISNYGHLETAANCQTQATYWYDCKTCDSNAKLADTTGMTEDEIAALKYTDGTVDINEHVGVESVPFKAPTCTEDGHSAYSKCTACGTEIVKKVTAGYEKKGHSYTGAYRIANVVDGEGNVTAYKHQRACVYGCGEYSDVTDCGFTAWKQNADGKTHSKSCVCGNELTGNCEANSNASCEDAATCKYCGSEMAGTTTGHNWGEWTSDGNGKTHSRVCLTNSSHKEKEDCGGGVASGCGAIYCSVCSQQYATGVDHAWGDWTETVPATCTQKAERTRACTECSAVETESYGEVLGHDYDKDNDGKDDGVVTTQATCTTAGTMTYTCLNNCGETYTSVIKALNHELEKEWTTVVEPTCDKEGKQIKACVHEWTDANGNTVKCDYFEENFIPKDSSKHVPGEWITDESESNCTTGVKSYKYCTVCGLEVDEKTEKTSHEWKADTIVFATCTENGYIKMICDNCGAPKTFNENTPGFPNSCDETSIDSDIADKLISKKEHTFATKASGDAEFIYDKDGIVIYVKEAATCSKTGKGYKVCTVEGCGMKVNVTIGKADHVYKTMPASAATCQTPGHTEYLACRNCSYTTEATKIPKLGHVDKDADGKCDRCKFEMYTNDNGGSSACGCMCHNSSGFIKNLIYPIARFFWKLFKTNKSCSCGNVHY